jgi:CubicO group peptidase (beta-lactamase class C family)
MSRIQGMILEGIAQGMFPCAVAYASRRGDVLCHEAFGAHTYDADSQPCTTGDLFDLASLTKLYTATVALRLVEEGTLRLDEAVRRIVPEVRGGWSVEDLLAHRTGASAALLEHAVARGIRPCEPGQERALWRIILDSEARVALRGDESLYSDVDFLLLQAVCERAAGELLDALMEPLGFIPSSALLIGGLSVFYGIRNIALTLAISLGVPTLMFYVFTRLLKVYLPEIPEL